MIKFRLPEEGLFYEFVVFSLLLWLSLVLFLFFEFFLLDFLEEPWFPSCPPDWFMQFSGPFPWGPPLPSCGIWPDPPPCGPPCPWPPPWGPPSCGPPFCWFPCEAWPFWLFCCWLDPWFWPVWDRLRKLLVIRRLWGDDTDPKATSSTDQQSTNCCHSNPPLRASF